MLLIPCIVHSTIRFILLEFQSLKIVAQVIFILLTLSLRLSFDEKVKLSMEVELQTGTPFI